MKTIFLTIAACGICLSSSIVMKQGQSGTLAVVYYWKAKPGKLQEYNRYIREVAEPIDEDARRHGAFLSVTTFTSSKPDSAWSHMRIFVLKDSLQLANLVPELNAAGARLEPDEAKRKARADYAATLRDFVSQEVVALLH